MSLLDGAFVLAVTGAAMVHPAFAPIVAAVFLLGTWWINEERREENERRELADAIPEMTVPVPKGES